MATHEEAERVQLLVEGELIAHDETVGSGLRPEGDGWMVVIYLQKEMPTGFVPQERDGVRIITEVVGVIEPQ
jgi:hypothetical protein